MVRNGRVLVLMLLTCSSVVAMQQESAQVQETPIKELAGRVLQHHLISYEHLQPLLLGEAHPLAQSTAPDLVKFAQQAVRVHKGIIRRLEKGEAFEPDEVSERYPPVFRAILTGQMKPDEKGELWVCSKECDGIGYAHVAFPQCTKLFFEPSTFEKQLTDEVGCLTQLRVLSLAGHRLAGLPDQLSGLANLKYLDLSENEFTEFPPPIRSLAKLRKLDLDGNRISKIPEALGCAATLTHLSLVNNGMRELSSSIGQFVNLKHLWLPGNQLKVVPPEIWGLKCLRDLSLSYNDLEALPDEICNLAELRTLTLEYNSRLKQLPPTISQLCKLRHLRLPIGLFVNDELKEQLPKGCTID